MSKVSKTARASMGGMQVQQKAVVPDSVLVQRYRDNREAKLWPPLEQSDAVLRTLDTALADLPKLATIHVNEVAELKGEIDTLKIERQLALDLLNQHLKGRVYTDLNDAVRNMLQVYVTTKDNLAELDVEAQAENVITNAEELGLTASQGQDSIGA